MLQFHEHIKYFQYCIYFNMFWIEYVYPSSWNRRMYLFFWFLQELFFLVRFRNCYTYLSVSPKERNTKYFTLAYMNGCTRVDLNIRLPCVFCSSDVYPTIRMNECGTSHFSVAVLLRNTFAPIDRTDSFSDDSVRSVPVELCSINEIYFHVCSRFADCIVLFSVLVVPNCVLDGTIRAGRGNTRTMELLDTVPAVDCVVAVKGSIFLGIRNRMSHVTSRGAFSWK